MSMVIMRLICVYFSVVMLVNMFGKKLFKVIFVIMYKFIYIDR